MLGRQTIFYYSNFFYYSAYIFTWKWNSVTVSLLLYPLFLLFIFYYIHVTLYKRKYSKQRPVKCHILIDDCYPQQQGVFVILLQTYYDFFYSFLSFWVKVNISGTLEFQTKSLRVFIQFCSKYQKRKYIWIKLL